MLPLVPYTYLDPREREEALRRPITRAVNIPLSELPDRMHELPPKTGTVQVAADEPLASHVVQWLYSQDRQAKVAPEFVYLSQQPEEIGRLWAPNSFLEEWSASLLEGGRALDLACGSGREAVYLKSQGWLVTALDRLPDALQKGRELEQRYTPRGVPIVWQIKDLESEPPDFQHQFQLITLCFYLHRPLLPRLKEWLAPGGSIFIETFTALHRARHKRPASDKHVLQSGELPTFFSGLSVSHYSEEWRQYRHTARILLRDESRVR